MTIRIAACDDNAAFAAEFRQFLQEMTKKPPFDQHVFEIETFTSSEELLRRYPAEPLDILLLDISMPDPDGFEVARIFTEKSPGTYLLFVSGYEEQVYYSLRFRPYRFLRKSAYEDEAPEAIRSVLQDLAEKNDVLSVKEGETLTAVPVRLICYVVKEKMTNYVRIVTESGEYRYRATIRQMQERLGEKFLPAGASTLVNARRISRLEGRIICFDNGMTLSLRQTASYSAFVSAYLVSMRSKD